LRFEQNTGSVSKLRVKIQFGKNNILLATRMNFSVDMHVIGISMLRREELPAEFGCRRLMGTSSSKTSRDIEELLYLFNTLETGIGKIDKAENFAEN
jgi:hypothetical protein